MQYSYVIITSWLLTIFYFHKPGWVIWNFLYSAHFPSLFFFIASSLKPKIPMAVGHYEVRLIMYGNCA